MSWPRFLLFNAAGGIVWAAAYGFGSYFLGATVNRLIGPIGIVLGVVAALVIITSTVFVHRNASRLEQEAQKALPGPIHGRGRKAA